MTTRIPIELAILGCCATLAAAQGLNIKPGLWELTGTSETKGDPMSMMSAADKAEMEEAKTYMSPEQWAQVEALMKQRNVTLGGPAKTSITLALPGKVCITEENIHQTLAYFAAKYSAGENCKITPIRSTATLVENREVCSWTNGSTSNSTLLLETPNPESFTARVESSVGGRGGLEMKARSSGKWLGSACGSVKP
jgi:hypothetical protein